MKVWVLMLLLSSWIVVPKDFPSKDVCEQAYQLVVDMYGKYGVPAPIHDCVETPRNGTNKEAS